jgi:hypothetical protein
MRRDEPSFGPFSTEDPADGIDVSALHVRYCIGDDEKPDEIVELRANGAFLTDSKIKAEITELPVAANDIYVRAAHVPGQGVAAYVLAVWLVPELSACLAPWHITRFRHSNTGTPVR